MNLKLGLSVGTPVTRLAAMASFWPVLESAHPLPPITFTGEDLNAGPGASHPVSSAAAAAFNTAASAIGTVSTITFESAPVGNFSSLVVAPGVTMTGTGYNGISQSVNSDYDHAYPSLDGFNTTPGGKNFVQVNSWGNDHLHVRRPDFLLRRLSLGVPILLPGQRHAFPMAPRRSFCSGNRHETALRRARLRRIHGCRS